MNCLEQSMDSTDWLTRNKGKALIQDRGLIPGRIQRIHSGYSVKDNKRPHTMIAMATNAELQHHNPSSHRHRSYRLNSNNPNPEMVTSDPDNEPEELSKVDEELARKRRELQLIEKQIRRKKTTIAMKTTRPSLESSKKAKTPCRMFKEDREDDLSRKVDSSVKNTQPFMSTGEKYVPFICTGENYIPFISTGEKDVGFSCRKWSSAYNNGPLKERVNVILQKGWPDGFLAKAFSTATDHLPSPNPVEKTNSLTLNKDDHPLKLRVKALMNRHYHFGLLDSHGEVPVEPQPPSQSPTTTVVENNLIVKGFQRFLGVLNKGVDIEMLTKIVKDPPTGQGLLHNQIPVVKEKSGVCKSDSQRFQCGAGQRDRRSCSEERKSELLNQDISNEGCKRNTQREEKSTQSRVDGHFGSSRRSRSPPVVEEKKPRLEQHQEELQSILKTIGFSLDADDMCKLTARTQERLYGIKQETKQRLDSTEVSKGCQQHVQSDHSPSSSSTSVADRPSSSPSHHHHSPSKTFRDSREQTQSPEYLHFGQRSREKGRERDGDGDKNATASRDQYTENPEYLVAYPDAACAIPVYNSDAASAIPSYTSVQHSEYTAYQYHSDTSNCVSNDIPPSSSSYPPVFCNYSMMTPLCPPADTGSLYGHVYPHPYIHPYPPAGCNTALGHSYFNTDLSLIEGQTGQRSLPHDLHINPHCQTEVTNMKIRTKQPAVQINGQEWSNGKKELYTIEQNSDLSLSEGQTGQKSDLRYLHVINTVQHSAYTDYHRDTSKGATSAWNDVSNDIPPSSSCPPGFCNSMNLLCPSADTGALLGQVYPHPPAGYNDALGKSYLNLDLSLTETEGQTRQKPGSHYIHVINTEKFIGTGKKSVQKEIKRQKQRRLILGRAKQENKRQLAFVRKSIARVNCCPLINLQEKQKKLEKLAGVEQDILKRLEQNSDLSLSEGQTVTKVKFQTEEKKMAEQKEGQKESQRSIQVQQLEVELPTEEEINADLTKKKQNPDRPLSEGPTRQQSDLCHPHTINTVQHSEYTAYHSDTSNGASLTALNSGSNEIPPSSSSYYHDGLQKRCSPSRLKKQLKYVRKCIARTNCDPTNNSELRQKLAEKEHVLVMILKKRNTELSLRERNAENRRQMENKQKQLLLQNTKWKKKTLEQNLDLPLSKCQTGQKSAIITVTKAKLQTEEKKMAEQNEGQKEHQKSVQGQQLEVELPTEEEINADPTKKEQNPDLSLSEGPTRQQSDLCHPHAINTVQHSECTTYHSDTSNTASLTAWNSGSNVIPPSSSSCTRGLLPVGKGRSTAWLKKELRFVRKNIARANRDTANNSEWRRKQLAAKEQDILIILKQNSDLPLSEGQTGQQSAIITVTKEKFQTEEKKMAEQKEGQKESQRSIQGQQLEVELPTEEEINADLTKKEQNPNLPLSEGPTGQQSDLCHPHAINTVQHSEYTAYHSDTSNGASLTALNFEKCIARINCDPTNDSELRQKLAAKEQVLVMNLKKRNTEVSLRERNAENRRQMENKQKPLLSQNTKWKKKTLEQNSDLPHSKCQTGQKSAIITVTKAKLQTEEKKMAEQKEGQKEHQKSVQGQQLEVELPTEEEINADPTKVSEGPTGQQSDLCHPHAINTVQHSECTTYHSDTSNGASSTAWNSGSNDIPNSSSSCTRGLLPVGKGRSTAWLKKELKFVRKCIARANRDTANNSEWRQKQLAAKEQDILTILKQNSDMPLSEGLCYPHAINTVQHSEYTAYHSDTSNSASSKAWNSGSNDIPPSSSSYPPGLRPVRMGDSDSCLREELNFVRKCIVQANCDTANNSEWRRKQLAGKEQYILMILKKNSELSPSEGQTGQKSAVNTVTKAKVHTEEKKIVQAKEQKESQRSIQGQLEVELSTEEEMNANLTTLRAGQTGQKSLNSSSYCPGLISCLEENGLSPSLLKKQLKYVKKCIVRENYDSSDNSKWRLKHLAAKEQHLLMKLKQDEPLYVRRAREAKQIISRNQKKARLAHMWNKWN